RFFRQPVGLRGDLGDPLAGRRVVGLAKVTTWERTMLNPVKWPGATPAPEGPVGSKERGLNRWLLAALLAALLFWGSTPGARAGVHGAWGGGGGDPFNEVAPAGGQLAEIWVRSGDKIDAILLVWRRPDGGLVYSPWYGGGGGRIQKFQMAPGER